MTRPGRAKKATAGKPTVRTPKPTARTPKRAAPKAAKRMAAAASPKHPAAAPRTDEQRAALFAAARRDAPELFESLADQDETTHFITVDLEIGSRGKLDLVATELGPHTMEMYRGKIGSLDHAHYEAGGGDTIDETIENLLRLLRRLSPAAKRQWRAAKVRDFNIGIQAGVKPNSLELTASAKTMQEVARLGGRLVITIYAYRLGRDSLSG